MSIKIDLMLKGILFDIDGTLLLSNDAHAHAWVDAFAEYGYDVAFEDVRKLIGMGGDKLVKTLCPELDESEGDGQKIKQRRSEIFLEKYAADLLPAPGARDLVEAAQAAGLKTVVATSAKKAELETLLKAAGVDDLLTEATTSDDADSSKPDPDIVHAALDKIGLEPAEVVMIGDTPYDLEAAGRAGVRCIGLKTGGWSAEELEGAIAVFESPADLLARRSELGY